MGDADSTRANALLELIADELYLVRRDKEDEKSGPMTEWKQHGRKQLLDKMGEMRFDLRI